MNTRNGSTSPVLEDPTALAPDSKEPQGHKPEETDEPVVQQPEVKDPEGKDTPPPKAETPAPGKKTADAPAEDPIAAAVARLANDAPKAPEDKAAKAQPAKAGDAQTTEGAPAEPAKTEDSAEKPTTAPAVTDPDDALNGWTEQERKHTKGTVKARFRDLHTRVRDLEPDAEAGKEWGNLIQAEQLTPDVKTLTDKQLAWSIKAQGAAVRAVQAVQQGLVPSAADLAIVDQLRTGLTEVDKAIGRRAAPTDPVAIAEAFTGPVPDDLREQCELAGLSAKETRLIAALRAHKPSATPTPAAAPVPAVVPQTPKAEPTTEHQQVRQPSPTERLYAAQSNEAIRKTGVQPGGEAAFFDANIAPILAQNLTRDYPGRDPGKLFASFGPAERHQLVINAIEDHRARTRTTTQTQTTTKVHTPIRAGGGGTGPGVPTDIVKAAVARLANDG